MIARDTVLKEVIDALVARFAPSRIVLFGSRARGDARPDSDYDLVVEIDGPVTHELKGQAISLACEAARHSVDVVMRQRGDIEARRDDPGYLDWDIHREGVVVYQASSSVDRVRERPRDPSSIPGWVRTARTDIRVMELCLREDDVPWPGVGFHAQQAAEKYLKAAIVAAGLRPKRTHALKQLVAQLRGTGADLPDLDDACDALAPYAVDERYHESLPPFDQQNGERAEPAMRAIVAAVTPHLGGWLDR